MTTYEKYPIGTLVESLSYGFGRVIDRGYGWISVKFSHYLRNPVVTYSLLQANRFLTVHEEEKKDD